ncbi:alpha/beta fold hydrolase [Thalassotalea sp. M1531]|uniref:Alpha/beta fold hydrolase n=2 Tax=Thalassotalea algicola TaxID=2716224 RepID=A0A7Y0L9P2_9GAMM|nr:alpha/beta fold hydrolase [Thalassotalea algicola]
MAYSSTETHALSLSTERDLNVRYQNEISAAWQQGHFSSFKGMDDINIHFAQFVSEERKQCIVLVPGRSEGYLKYQEFAFDLTNQGFNLFIIDHRGQGLSDRMLSDKHKGYVASFDHYSDDLHQFIETIVKPQCEKQLYLLAHSMGGAISARYLQRYASPVKAAVLASPMIAINSGGLPDWLAEFIIHTGNTLSQWLANEPWYFLGQGSYQHTAFGENQLMHSKLRYQLFTELYQQHPELQLGGVTFHWLEQAIKANKDLFSDIEKLKTPTLVIQAGSDTIVDNHAQNEFCQQLNSHFAYSCPSGKPIVVENARHEIFFESDEYRQQGIAQVLDWFNQPHL